MPAHFLNDTEWKFFKAMQRRFGGDFLSSGDIAVPGIDGGAPITQWVQVISSMAVTVNDRYLYPARPVLMWQDGGGIWDSFDEVWVRGPKGVEFLAAGNQLLCRMYGNYLGKPVYVGLKSESLGNTDTGTGTPNIPCPSIPGVNLEDLDEEDNPDWLLSVTDGCLTKTSETEVPETGTDATCDEVIFTSYRVRCEPTEPVYSAGTGDPVTLNNLNEYAVDFTLSIGEDGCPILTEGDERYVQTIGCCDPRCADDIPATGTGTSPDSDIGTGTGTDAGASDCGCDVIPSVYAVTFSFTSGNCTQFTGAHDLQYQGECVWSKTFVGGDGQTYEIRLTFGGTHAILQLYLVHPSVGVYTLLGSFLGTAPSSCCTTLTLSKYQEVKCSLPATIALTPECGDTGTEGGATINNDCCSGIPTTLTATLSGGSCACLSGKVVTLTYDSGTGQWRGTTAVSCICNPTVYVSLGCGTIGFGEWAIGISCSAYITPNLGRTSQSCGPVLVSFTGYSSISCCGIDTINATITE